MDILSKEELANLLYEYYVEHYGEKDTDEWFEPPALNVCTFRRGDKYISLKAHILTGKVEEFIEKQ